MTSMDPERIQAVPTTDAEPPAATSVVTGPSQVPTSQADGRGRRSWGRRALIGLVLVATFTVGIGVGQVAPSVMGGASATPNPATASELDLFKEAWDAIHTQYVGRAELDDRALVYAAINGLTEAVGDTGHTSFMTPEERAARSNALSGSYVGIGVRVTATENGQPQIVSIFPNSPAESSGVKVGDVMVKVDGVSTDGRAMDDVLTDVRGEAGTDVDITVRADGTGPERTYTITRADVALEPVTWTMVPGTKTALLYLDSFSTGSADAVIKALEEIKTAEADR